MADGKRKLIIDHDAGVDDLASIAIAMLSGQFKIDAITICPADSLKEPAIQVTVALVKFLGGKGIEIAASDNEGVNRFPEKWRKDSGRLAQIEELKILPKEYGNFGYSTTPAADKLAVLLSKGAKYEILETGPLSNIADALKTCPQIAKNISKIYFMGGAIRVQGNVEAEEHDLTAEWNAYNNPQAVSAVLAAGIPVVFVPLDATNQAPVTTKFMKALGSQDDYRVSSLFHKIWNVIAPQIESESYQQTYFFWDALTSAFAANPTIGRVEREKIKVIETGRSQGRTVSDPGGYPIEVLSNPDANKLEQFILSTFKR
jgi:purine nucleosidase